MQDFSDVLKQIFNEDRSFFIDVSDIVKRDKDSETDIPIFPNHHNDLDLTQYQITDIIESKPQREVGDADRNYSIAGMGRRFMPDNT